MGWKSSQTHNSFKCWQSSSFSFRHKYCSVKGICSHCRTLIISRLEEVRLIFSLWIPICSHGFICSCSLSYCTSNIFFCLITSLADLWQLQVHHQIQRLPFSIDFFASSPYYMWTDSKDILFSLWWPPWLKLNWLKLTIYCSKNGGGNVKNNDNIRSI